MSVRVMSRAWDADLPATDKLVLLALADWSNDSGACWPSIAQLKIKCGLSERAVQGAIKRLSEGGHLRRVEKAGKGVDYTIHPRTTCTPADLAPPQQTTETPAPPAPNTSVTTIDDGCVARARALTDSPEWKAFKAMRREIHKPLNDTATKRIIAKLGKLEAEHGFPPGEVLEQSTANCWRDVYPLKDDDDGPQRKADRNGAQSLGGSDPLLEMHRAANAAIARSAFDHH